MELSADDRILQYDGRPFSPDDLLVKIKGVMVMTGRQIITDAQNTWCPGCGNFSIQHTLKNVLNGMEKEGQVT